MRVAPATVAPGAHITVTTTSSARVCSLTIRIAGVNYRFRLHRNGDNVRISRRAPLGVGSVNVRCGQLVAATTFTIALPAALTAPSSAPANAPVTTRTAPPPAPAATPWTVYNVCHFNPGLGPVTTGNGNGIPYAFWRNIAWSTDGNSTVDAAAVLDGSQITYLAICSQQNWIVVGVAEQQAQTNPTSPAAQQTTTELDNLASQLGAINPTTPDGPGCAGASGIYGGSCQVQSDP
jgi:hypothetical protein